LTGQYIFDAETISEIHQKQLATAPTPPGQRTTNPISPEMEQILLRCLEKEADLRPQSAGELQALLLACPAAEGWTPAERAAWWEACDRQPFTSQAETATAQSTPMATVRIDLASRIE